MARFAISKSVPDPDVAQRLVGTGKTYERSARAPVAHKTPSASTAREQNEDSSEPTNQGGGLQPLAGAPSGKVPSRTSSGLIGLQRYG